MKMPSWIKRKEPQQQEKPLRERVWPLTDNENDEASVFIYEKDLPLEKVPRSVRGNLYVKDMLASEQFASISRFVHARGNATYVITALPDANKVEQAYFIDSEDGIIAGTGVLRFSKELEDSWGLKVPYVEQTNTHGDEEEGFKRLGFGERRLYLMNEFCKTTYGILLHSGITQERFATEMWKKLVQEGKAEPFLSKQGSKETRYRFIV